MFICLVFLCIHTKPIKRAISVNGEFETAASLLAGTMTSSCVPSAEISQPGICKSTGNTHYTCVHVCIMYLVKVYMKMVWIDSVLVQSTNLHV